MQQVNSFNLQLLISLVLIGIKFWAIVDNVGYLSKFEIYCGKEGERINKLGETVVLQFVDELEQGSSFF